MYGNHRTIKHDNKDKRKTYHFECIILVLFLIFNIFQPEKFHHNLKDIHWFELFFQSTIKILFLFGHLHKVFKSNSRILSIELTNFQFYYVE